jgi:hypothetical protein
MSALTPAAEAAKPLVTRLEEFACDMALILAGWVLKGPPNLTPYDRDQLAVLLIAAVAAHARTQSDYDADMDITQVIQLGAFTYGEATKANMVAVINDLVESIPDDDDVVIPETEADIERLISHEDVNGPPA